MPRLSRSPRPLRPRAAREPLVLVLVLAALGVGACGGRGARTAGGARGADAGADGGVGPLATSAPPGGLPPMATMPPPGVTGSKKAKKRPDPGLASCAGAARPSAKDPADHVKKVGEGCAAASKMKPVGAPIRGQQGDKDPHQEHRFRAEANRCYRVYVAGEEAAQDVVVVLRDSAGDVVAEGPAPAVPQEGAVCFTAGDEVTVLVGVGSGRGGWAAQVWSD